ncbi:hypothetical protein BGW42_003666 [Actinomortierella wolfii]|nr:hypothetical protein BGW42_003666 [Actinomortierella wolfii]
MRSTVSCPSCPDSNCYKCQLGNEPTLTVNTGGRAYIRALVGFILPDGAMTSSTEITACSIQFPAFKKPLQYGVNVTVSVAKSPDWEESTVSAETAPEAEEGDPLVIIEVPPYTNLGRIDVTSVCQKAQSSTDGQFSIYLGAVFGYYEIWSKDSGNPAILHVTYQ